MLQKNVDFNNKTVLITGGAGFIGSFLILKLLESTKSLKIVCLDSVDNYYDCSLKEYRLAEIKKEAGKHPESSWILIRGNIADKELVNSIFEQYKFDIVVNLAAQAGVRNSIDCPDVYIESNIIGFFNILEACRHFPVEHFVYASSSSVYGENNKIPFSVNDKADYPVSLYAATKKSDELLAHVYSKLYDIPTTGLRFFTVYGPAGRPDMSYFKFTDNLVQDKTIQIFNNGHCFRDFTYIGDIVTGIILVMQCAPEKKIGEDGLPIPPYRLYNIGNNHPENLLDFINILYEELVRADVLPKDYNIECHKKFMPMQPGDVPITYADTSDFLRDFGFKPNTDIRTGLREFAEWYKNYFML